MPAPAVLPLIERERIAVVCDPGGVAAMLRARYPRLQVVENTSYLSGIAALADGPARGLLVGVDPAARRLELAVAGLRKAAGPQARLVLCCPPATEPSARQVLSAGADDYVIWPPRGEELDRSLGLAGPAGLRTSETLVDPAAPSWDELHELGQVLAGLADGRSAMLRRVAQWLSRALRTAELRLRVEDDLAAVGDADFEPALLEQIEAQGRVVGRIELGPRHKSPYTAAEARKLHHYAGMIAHLLEAARQQQAWQSLAMIDQVTQLPNRRYLLQALDELLRWTNQQRFRVTVLLFDLDGFKHFNDKYGHAAGDEILAETSKLFRRHCREHDIVARYAGDEFVVVFWDAEEPRVAGSRHPTDVFAVLRRIKKALHHHMFPKLGPEARGCITISGGLASYPWDAHDVQGLIDAADAALLKAKQAGKNRIFLVGRSEKGTDLGGPAEPPAPQADADHA